MWFFSGHAINQATVHGKLDRDYVMCVDNDIVLGVDPHSYTSGRWLRDDNHERHIRRIDFNFDELCRKILDLSHEARSIKNCEKKEGGFNRVFIFTMDDGSRVVARLPFTFAGPAKLATASEVATIQYCAWSNRLEYLFGPH